MSVRADAVGDFDAWVRPHLSVMGAVAARLAGPGERDDVVQDAVIRAWRRFETFDPDRGTARVWLAAIAADQARKARRRRMLTGARSGSLEVDVPAGQADRELLVDVERALGRLPRRLREVIDLVYFVGLTQAEAAQVLGISEGTVKSHAYDARERLRPLLSGVLDG